MDYPLKYDVKISVQDIDFVDKEAEKKFSEDFDEVYNLFAHKLGNLMGEYGVKSVDACLSPLTKEYLSLRKCTVKHCPGL